MIRPGLNEARNEFRSDDIPFASVPAFPTLRGDSMLGTRFGSLFLTLVIGLCGRCAQAAQSISLDLRPLRPNFIIIIADDMAWNDSGAYGHPSLSTPNIDRLAAEGMKFNQALDARASFLVSNILR